MKSFGILGILVFCLGVQNTFAQSAKKARAGGAKSGSTTADEASDLARLRPDAELEVPSLYRDMGVVQRKAMDKDGKFLINFSSHFDFSDAPYTMFGINTDLGFAVSDFFEIWAHVTPFFLSSARPYVSQVIRDLQYPDSSSVTVVGKPVIEYGGYVLWAPAYGKDSIGANTIIRSDTFFRLGAGLIQFEDDISGLKFSLGVGKTFFMARSAGLRFVGTAAMIETPNIAPDGQPAEKSFKLFGLLEVGLVFYL